MYAQYISKGYFSLVKLILKIIENIFSVKIWIFILPQKKKENTTRVQQYAVFYYRPYSSNANCQSCVEPFTSTEFHVHANGEKIVFTCTSVLL